MPTTLRGALEKASEEVKAWELVAVAKHIGGRGAEKEANAIRIALAAERGGYIVAGDRGREFKRRLEAAGLIPKDSTGKPIGIARKPLLTPVCKRDSKRRQTHRKKCPSRRWIGKSLSPNRDL
jgi:hypothetical protein